MNIRDQIASARALADAATKGPLLFRGKDLHCVTNSVRNYNWWLAASTLVPQLATLLERACELLEAYGKECPCRGDPACDVCPQSRAFLAGEVKP